LAGNGGDATSALGRMNGGDGHGRDLYFVRCACLSVAAGRIWLWRHQRRRLPDGSSGRPGFRRAAADVDADQEAPAKTLSRVQLLQLDSVKRRGPRALHAAVQPVGRLPASLLDEAAWSHSARRPRMLVEYWAHVASLNPGRSLGRCCAPGCGGTRPPEGDQPALLADVLTVVKQGPIGAGADRGLLGGSSAPRPKGGWWNRSAVNGPASTCSRRAS